GGPDPADGFADLAARANNTQTVTATNRGVRLGIDTNDRGWKAMRQQRRNAADRPSLAFDIVERKIAFGRRIEFENLRNRKARLKGLPDIAAQAIAACQPKPVDAFIFGRRRFQKIAAELADILEQRAVPAH